MEYNSTPRKHRRSSLGCRACSSPLAWVALLALSIISLYSVSTYIGQGVNKRLQNHLCPDTLSTETVFTAHKEFQSISPANDKYWADLLPQNGGFLALKNSEGKAPGIAMFHQLHCLQMIRSGMQSLLKGNGTQVGQIHHHPNALGGIDDHILHCFDYIRQVRGI